MKILIVGALDPHENQDEKQVCERLSEIYTKLGHITDICYLPFKMDYHGIHEQILAYRLLTTFPESEMLIAVGYPAFALKHPNKHTILLEFLPEFHANYNTEYGCMEQWYCAPKDREKWENLLRVEKKCLMESKTIHCTSPYLTKEMTLLGCTADTIEIPMAVSERTEDKPVGEYLVRSCLAPMDRIDLLLDAMQKTNINLRIYIPSAEKCYIEAVQARVNRLLLTERVNIVRSDISKKDLETCRGVICLRRFAGHIPAYVTIAVASRIPCIVLSDGGALSELTQSDYIKILNPKPTEIAAAMMSFKSHKKNDTVIDYSISDKTKNILEKLVK